MVISHIARYRFLVVEEDCREQLGQNKNVPRSLRMTHDEARSVRKQAHQRSLAREVAVSSYTFPSSTHITAIYSNLSRFITTTVVNVTISYNTVCAHIHNALLPVSGGLLDEDTPAGGSARRLVRYLWFACATSTSLLLRTASKVPQRFKCNTAAREIRLPERYPIRAKEAPTPEQRVATSSHMALT